MGDTQARLRLPGTEGAEAPTHSGPSTSPKERLARCAPEPYQQPLPSSHPLSEDLRTVNSSASVYCVREWVRTGTIGRNFPSSGMQTRWHDESSERAHRWRKTDRPSAWHILTSCLQLGTGLADAFPFLRHHPGGNELSQPAECCLKEASRILSHISE